MLEVYIVKLLKSYIYMNVVQVQTSNNTQNKSESGLEFGVEWRPSGIKNEFLFRIQKNGIHFFPVFRIEQTFEYIQTIYQNKIEESNRAMM